MAKICVYYISTGQARWNTECPDGMEESQTANMIDTGWVAVDQPVNGNTHYLPGGVVTPRPQLAFDKTAIAADDADAAVLHLDEPFTAVVDDQSYLIDKATNAEGVSAQPNSAGVYELALSSPMPAAYKVEIKHWPYQDYAAEISAS